MSQPQREVYERNNDKPYDSGRESGSDGQAGETSDLVSSPNEDMEAWNRNIRTEMEANPDTLDERTIHQYWGELCGDPAADQYEEQIGDRRTITSKLSELLDTKIAVGEILLRTAPPQHSLRPFLLFHLSDNLGRRFRYRGVEELGDLDRAIRLAETGVGLFRENPPIGPPEQSIDIIAMGLLNLGTLLLAHYESTKITDSLEKAILHTKHALHLVRSGSHHLPTRLTALKNLPLMLVLRCQWIRRMEDLDEAYRLAEYGLSLAKREAYPEERVAGYQWLLSISSETRYQLTGDIATLSKAIELASKTVAGTSTVSKKVSYLRYLSVMLELRYTALGDLGDIAEAIKHAEYGLDILAEANNPELHEPSAPGGSHHFLRLLADLHEAKYQARGDFQDLNKSLAYQKRAIETFDVGDAKGFIGLAGFVTSLRSRYIGAEALDHVNESLVLLEEAVEDNLDMRERTLFISSLGALYEARYSLTRSPGDLDRAVSMSEASISFLPQSSPELPKFHGELARRLQLRYRSKKRIGDLEAAIAWGAQALTEAPATSILRPSLLNSLSQALSLLYLESQDPNDLDFALSIGSEATEEFPEYHPEFAPAMINLGELFFNAFQAEQSEEEKSQWLYWALQFFINALQCPSTSPRFRLHAAGQAAKTNMVLGHFFEQHREQPDNASATIRGHWENAYEILSEAVGLLPILSCVALTLEDEQWHLSQHLNLASNAAAMAIKCERSALQAARLLEAGRGIIMGNLIESRQEIFGLERANPDLAREFDVLRQKVDGMLVGPRGEAGVQGGFRASLLMFHRQEQRLRDVNLLERTLEKIRGMPGFENFLYPSEAEFKEAARYGPIVAINVTENSSDAIIIQSTGVSSLRLQQLSSSWVKKQIGMIDRKILKSRELAPDKNRRMRALLEMLWVAVVKPVLQELGFYTNQKSSSALPHIWWIGVGTMAKAPFHAAGCYPKSPNSPKAEYTSKYCISSYTPTVKALLYSRAREEATIQNVGLDTFTDKALFITMPRTPGDKDFPKAKEEAESIISFLPSGITKTLLISPSSRLALEQIQGHNMIHFACHGITEFANPAKSRIVLFKGPGEVETLTVKAISEVRRFQPVSPNGTHSLAYLSACISGDSSSEDLGQEVLHIASSFQLAGFSHVVGTLWIGDDTVSKKVAEEFYKALFQCGEVRGSSRGEREEVGDPAAAVDSTEGGRVPVLRMTCAEALHRAVDKVKIVEGYWWNPLDWAQFCHWGA
ncbi:CHAT domain-containing protein [Tirmania nivea]|nr:CHAT domain-containing protein [Tirmania nivea]